MWDVCGVWSGGDGGGVAYVDLCGFGGVAERLA